MRNSLDPDMLLFAALAAFLMILLVRSCAEAVPCTPCPQRYLGSRAGL
jgi:hypothetical protein